MVTTSQIMIDDGLVMMPDIPCKRVWVRCSIDNVAAVWMGVNTRASKGHGWPFDPGGYFPESIKVNNVNELDFHFEGSGEKVCVIYET